MSSHQFDPYKNGLFAKFIAQRDRNEVGTYEIFAPAEDSAFRPGTPKRLAVVSGPWHKVVEHAVNLPGFVGWGDGGDIRPLEIVNL